MAITIAISFPWGRYHGNPWGRNVNEGMVDWPPSPWRLLRALYATWQHRAPQLDAELVHCLLGKLSALPTYVVPPYTVAHTRHYMPDHRGGTDKVLDTFAAFAPADPLLVHWPVDLNADEREALATLCGLLSYLGRAESICEARLIEGPKLGNPGSATIAEPLPSDSDELSSLLLAAEEDLEGCDLTVRPSRLRREGHVVPAGTRRVRYPRIEPAWAEPFWTCPSVRHLNAARFAIAGPVLPARTAAVAICDVFRSAVMSNYGRLNGADSSPTLAGKTPDGQRRADQHQHAHYLAFCANPEAHAAGLLDTLVIWAPGKLNEAEAQAVESLSGVLLHRREYLSDFQPCRLGLEAIGSIEDVAPELCSSSTQWESFTPFAPARHGRPNKDWWIHVAAELNRELGYRGLPPASVSPMAPHESPGLTRGWLDFRRHRTKERLRAARRAVGARLQFDEPQVGPLALGALSHFGLGLFLPVSGI